MSTYNSTADKNSHNYSCIHHKYNYISEKRLRGVNHKHEKASCFYTKGQSLNNYEILANF